MKLISSAALVAIQAGDIAEAVNKLEKALARTDGCVLRGSPDGNGKVETGSPIAAPCSIYMAISAPPAPDGKRYFGTSGETVEITYLVDVAN